MARDPLPYGNDSSDDEEIPPKKQRKSNDAVDFSVEDGSMGRRRVVVEESDEDEAQTATTFMRIRVPRATPWPVYARPPPTPGSPQGLVPANVAAIHRPLPPVRVGEKCRVCRRKPHHERVYCHDPGMPYDADSSHCFCLNCLHVRVEVGSITPRPGHISCLMKRCERIIDEDMIRIGLDDEKMLDSLIVRAAGAQQSPAPATQLQHQQAAIPAARPQQAPGPAAHAQVQQAPMPAPRLQVQQAPIPAPRLQVQQAPIPAAQVQAQAAAIPAEPRQQAPVAPVRQAKAAPIRAATNLPASSPLRRLRLMWPPRAKPSSTTVPRALIAQATVLLNTVPRAPVVPQATVPQPIVPRTTVVPQATVPQPIVPQPTVPQATVVPQPTVPRATLVPQPTVPQPIVPQLTVPQPTVPQATVVPQPTVVPPATVPQPALPRTLTRERIRASLDARRETTPASSQLEEEPIVDDEEKEELIRLVQFVDPRVFEQMMELFPDISLGWLLRHADHGIEGVFGVVEGGGATERRLAPRSDSRGVTHVVKDALSSRTTFECVVCYSEYDDHLAIGCVCVDEEGDGDATHKFCAECVVGHAKAATEQQVIVRAGLGLKCMDPGCKNTLLRAHIEQVLDGRTREILEPLFADEALLAAELGVEKCQRCPFAAEMVDTAEEQPVFHCPRCRAAHCRRCDRPWDDKHKNRACDELDPDAMRKKVEEKLTEATMHKCPRCKKAFVKTDGCNKITCPCGAFSCYVCKALIKDYKHFRAANEPATSTKCQLHVDPTREEQLRRQQLLQEQINNAEASVAAELAKLK